LIDQIAEYTAEPAANTEQPADSPASAEIVQGLKNHELIERLRKELAEKTARIAELEQERDVLLQTIERAVDQGKPSGIDIMRVIEGAVLGLSGIEAYYTGAAIEQLWRWQTVEDLRRARHHIDRLVESVMVGAG